MENVEKRIKEMTDHTFGTWNRQKNWKNPLLITDAEVANWKQMVNTVEKLSKRGHKLFMFHIGSRKSSRTTKIHEALSKAGAAVYPINSVKDLPGLVVREVHSVYRK